MLLRRRRGLVPLTYRILTGYGGYTIRIWRNGTPPHSTTGLWNWGHSSMKTRPILFVRSSIPSNETHSHQTQWRIPHQRNGWIIPTSGVRIQTIRVFGPLSTHQTITNKKQKRRCGITIFSKICPYKKE